MATPVGGRWITYGTTTEEVGQMVVGRRDIKELRPEEEEYVLRWAAATGFDVEGALEVLKERYYKSMGVWAE